VLEEVELEEGEEVVPRELRIGEEGSEEREGVEQEAARAIVFFPSSSAIISDSSCSISPADGLSSGRGLQHLCINNTKFFHDVFLFSNAPSPRQSLGTQSGAVEGSNGGLAF